eukprot:m.9685 g.9685  ORF g.9685 m.9685 type:complete len:320 (+) comp4995_c0_seq1:82-1041(+)
MERELWRPFDIGGCVWLIKALLTDDSVEIAISDGVLVWHQELDGPGVLATARSLNAGLEPTLVRVLQLLQQKFEKQHDDTEYFIEIEGDERDRVVAGFRTRIGRMFFTWKFDCARSPPERLSELLIIPLMKMLCEVQRRADFMASLLEKKDREIRECQSTGGSSGRYATEPFMPATFMRECGPCRDIPVDNMYKRVTSEPMTSVFLDVMAAAMGPKRATNSLDLLASLSTPFDQSEPLLSSGDLEGGAGAADDVARPPPESMDSPGLLFAPKRAHLQANEETEEEKIARNKEKLKRTLEAAKEDKGKDAKKPKKKKDLF